MIGEDASESLVLWRILVFHSFGVYVETVTKVNSLTILLARLPRLCRKDEAQGTEGEV